MTYAEQEAMEIMMLFGKDGCKIMDSGGKDSTVLKHIAEKCHEKYGLEYSVHHNHTTLDAPETVYFVRAERERYRKAGVPYEIHYPKKTFGRLCIERGLLPTRIARFCCEELKESYGNRERVVTGVRRNESANRKANQGIITSIDATKKQVEEISGNPSFHLTGKGGVVLLNYDNDDAVQMVYTCFRTNKVLVNPLINWTDTDVWRCINDNKLPVNPLYHCGFDRVGCVGCPMAGKKRKRDFERYPKYKDRWIWIADQIVQKKKKEGLKKYTDKNFEDGKAYFKFWMEDETMDGQLVLNPDGTITEYEI